MLVVMNTAQPELELQDAVPTVPTQTVGQRVGTNKQRVHPIVFARLRQQWEVTGSIDSQEPPLKPRRYQRRHWWQD